MRSIGQPKTVDNGWKLSYFGKMATFLDEISSIKASGRYRRLVALASPAGPRVQVDGRELLMLASNDYLGLCSHPRMKQHTAAAVMTWGAGAGASRLVSGHNVLVEKLENRLAAFKETADALVFSSGYLANLGLLTTLARANDTIYSDALNHASIIDGCRLSRAHVETYPHCDTGALEDLVKTNPRPGRKIIVTDGVFSMEGDIAPLPDLLDIAARHDAMLIIDDAHASGTLGPKGRGTLEHFGLRPAPNVIIMGTMGKALGCFGAFTAGQRAVKELLVNRARSFIFTTALPPGIVGAAIEALAIIEEEPELIDRLQAHAAFMRRSLRSAGFRTHPSTTHIIPIIVGDSATAVAVARSLFQEGLFLQAIRPPSVPEGAARLRLTVMASHSREDLHRAVAVLEKVAKRYGII